ncbi:MAG: Fe-Mn family superoxide dismutase [Alphaproteobacteria bacterium]
MSFEVVPLSFKPSRLSGLSERLVASHYENNYGGAVRRLNAIAARLGTLDWAGAANFEINGLKREELVAMASAVLHEVHFDGLGGPGGDPVGALGNAIARDFGAIATWRREFTAMGKALGGGSGWVVLAWSPRAGRLVNLWAADHAHGLAGAVPILALDMYEHAYHLDFGANAAAWVDAFLANLDWSRIAARYEATVAGHASAVASADGDMSVATLQRLRADGAPVAVLDVRKADDRANGINRIAGDRWLDPARVAELADDVPRDRPVAVYCVYGFQVSRDAADALRARGIDARPLAGGIAAWRAMGGAVAPLDS